MVLRTAIGELDGSHGYIGSIGWKIPGKRGLYISDSRNQAYVISALSLIFAIIWTLIKVPKIKILFLMTYEA